MSMCVGSKSAFTNKIFKCQSIGPFLSPEALHLLALENLQASFNAYGWTCSYILGSLQVRLLHLF